MFACGTTYARPLTSGRFARTIKAAFVLPAVMLLAACSAQQELESAAPVPTDGASEPAVLDQKPKTTAADAERKQAEKKKAETRRSSEGERRKAEERVTAAKAKSKPKPPPAPPIVASKPTAPPAAANGGGETAESVAETSTAEPEVAAIEDREEVAPTAGTSAPRTRGVGIGGNNAGIGNNTGVGNAPGGEGGSAPPESAPTEAAAPVPDKDWNVVPVYFGTDRARNDKADRIAYDWRRGRRLELGRALVTIPKSHEVPKVERPWAVRIPYTSITLYEAAEDPKKHFTIQTIRDLSKEEFLDLVKKRLAKSERFKDHALVFVHGYQTKFDNAVYRTAQITYDMDFDGAPFLYSWPSGGTLQGYTYDRESAAQAEPHLRKFLTMVSQETGAKTVSLIAHSMGNQLALRVLQDLRRSLPDGMKLSQLILAAPDVDRDSFGHIVKSIAGIANGVTLYAAANDQALAISRRVNGGEPRAGDVPADAGPLIVEGVDTIDATATSMDSIGINHSGYAENNALLEDIKTLIKTGTRPPELRVPTLERITTDKGDYWRYPQN